MADAQFGAPVTAKPKTRSNYLRWFVADTSLTLGGALRVFAIPALVVIATGSEAKAGVIQSVAMLISGALMLFGGVLVDHVERRKLVLIQALSGVAIVGGATAWAWFYGLSFWLLLVLGVLMSIRSGLLSTASDALLRDVVPAKELPRRMAINEGRDAAVELGGGPIAGALVTWNWIATFAAEIALNVLALLAALGIRPLPEADDAAADARDTEAAPSDSGADDAATDASETEATPSASADAEGDAPKDDAAEDEAAAEQAAREKRRPLSTALAGFKVMFGDALLRRVYVLSVLFFPLINGFLLYLLLNTLKSGKLPISASLFNSATAVGVLAGSVLATKLVDRVPTGKLVAATFLVPVPLALAVTLVPWYWAKLALLVPLLFLLPSGNAAFGGFVMTIIPKNLLGRTFAATGLGGAAFAPLVFLGLGLSLEHLGATATGLILTAALALVSSASLTSRDLLSLPVPEKWGDYIKERGLTPVVNK